jgi:hypothetical protein
MLPNLEDQVPVFINPQEQDSPVILPGIGFVKEAKQILLIY